MRLFYLFLGSFVATPVWAAAVSTSNDQLVLAAEKDGKWYPLSTFSAFKKDNKENFKLIWDSTAMPTKITSDGNKYVINGFELGVSPDGFLAFMDPKTTNDKFVFDDAGKLVKNELYLCGTKPRYVVVNKRPDMDCSEVNIHVKFYDKDTRKVYSKTVGDGTYSETSNVGLSKDPKALFVNTVGKDGKKSQPISMSCTFSSCDFYWASSNYPTKFTWENSQLVTKINGESSYVCLIPDSIDKTSLDKPCDLPIKIDSNNKIENRELYQCDYYPGKLFFSEAEGCEKIDVYLLPYDGQTNGAVPNNADSIDTAATGGQKEVQKTPKFDIPPPPHSLALSGVFQVEVSGSKVPLSYKTLSKFASYLEYSRPNDALISPPMFEHDGKNAETEETSTPGFISFENGRVAFGETKNPAVFQIDEAGKLDYTFYSCFKKESPNTPELFATIQEFPYTTCNPETLYFLPNVESETFPPRKKKGSSVSDSRQSQNKEGKQELGRQTGSALSTDGNSDPNGRHVLTFNQKPEDLEEVFFNGSHYIKKNEKKINEGSEVNKTKEPLNFRPVAKPPRTSSKEKASVDLDGTASSKDLVVNHQEPKTEVISPEIKLRPIPEPPKSDGDGSVTDLKTQKTLNQTTASENSTISETQITTPEDNEGDNVAENDIAKPKTSVAGPKIFVPVSTKQFAESKEKFVPQGELGPEHEKERSKHKNKGPKHDLNSSLQPNFPKVWRNSTNNSSDSKPDFKGSESNKTFEIKVDSSKPNTNNVEPTKETSKSHNNVPGSHVEHSQLNSNDSETNLVSSDSKNGSSSDVKISPVAGSEIKTMNNSNISALSALESHMENPTVCNECEYKECQHNECQHAFKSTVWKTYTDYTTYCEQATTMTITRCEKECVPTTMTVDAAATLTVTGVCIVPETTTVGQTAKAHLEAKGGFSSGNQEEKVKGMELPSQNVGQQVDNRKGDFKPGQPEHAQGKPKATKASEPKATKASESKATKLMAQKAKNIDNSGIAKNPQSVNNAFPKPTTVPFVNAASKNAIRAACLVGFAALLF